MVLTNHNFTSKNLESGDLQKRKGSGESSNKNTSGLSQLVLIVNNWGFVRDTQHDSRVRPCTVSDFQVQLKLSSSAFRTAANPDSQFPFDKQAANFPYDSFEQLLKSSLTKSFVREVKSLYEETEGPIASDSDSEDNKSADNEGEEEEEEEDRPLTSVYKSLPKRTKK